MPADNFTASAEGQVQRVTATRRRHAPSLTTGGLATILAATGLIGRSEGVVPPSTSPATHPATSQPTITQADVDGEYGKLYDLVHKAQQDAQNHQKKLAIIACWNYASTPQKEASAILEGKHLSDATQLSVFSLIDIAGRRKITQGMLPNDDKILTATEQQDAAVLKGKARQLPITKFTTAFLQSALTSSNMDGMHGTDMTVMVLAGADRGVNYRGIDSNYNLRKKKESLAATQPSSSPQADAFYFDPALLKPLIDSATGFAQKDNSLIIVPAAYAPALDTALKGAGIETLCIQCTPGISIPAAQAGQKPTRFETELQQTLSYYTPALHGQSNRSPGQLYAMMLEASQLKDRPELTAQKVRDRRNFLDELIKDLQPAQAPATSPTTTRSR